MAARETRGGSGGGEGAPSPTRAARKRRDILHAAAAHFLAHGYAGTSMDAIAAEAAVSKQTIYKHFSDKESLFAEIVRSTVSEASGPVHDLVVGLEHTSDLEADLRDLARRQLALVMRPRLLQLRRLVIGESARFPKLGRDFYEQGPERTIGALATAFEHLSERGLLRLDGDARTVAAHFNWLVMSIPLNRAMLLGDDEQPDLDRYADEGVRVFLAAYQVPR
jgi:TetR/AcrR family transcriptional repressor of mexJK operon